MKFEEFNKEWLVMFLKLEVYLKFIIIIILKCGIVLENKI